MPILTDAQRGNCHQILRLFFYLLLCSGAKSLADADTDKDDIHIYIDADLQNHAESATAIQQGLHTALSRINHKQQGHTIKVIALDHRGSVKRSKRNLMKFLKDERALLVIGGMHSPPLIKNRTFINDNKILTLVPWAAGGPITRHPSTDNWVFRLSVDDAQAGEVLANYAYQKKQCKYPHLFLENTPWGNSNLKNMTRAFNQHGITAIDVTRFGWSLKGNIAREMLSKIHKSGAECILLVSDTIEGAVISEAMAQIDRQYRIPIISHWGITGGNFTEIVPADIRENIDLSFIQTCFSFMQEKLNPFQKNVFNTVKGLYPEQIKVPQDIKSPPGFIHTYDLMQILISAINQIELTHNMSTNRENLKLALEDLNGTTIGLIKNYQRPFSLFDKDNGSNNHEALSANDFCMGKFDKNNNIYIEKNDL